MPRSKLGLGLSIDRLLMKSKLHPVIEMIGLYREKDEKGRPLLKPGERLRLLETITQLKYPKLRATEGGSVRDSRPIIVKKEFQLSQASEASERKAGPAGNKHGEDSD